MGKKQNRSRKYFYFCIASLILFSIAGCATLEKKERKEKELNASERQRKANRHILDAQAYFDRGDFESFLKENQKALSLSRGATPGDEALFNLGLIYSHYKYPKRDYNKSLGYFRKLIKDYPKSQLVAQANIWIGVLEVIEEAKQVDIEIEKKKKELNTLERQRKANRHILDAQAYLDRGDFESFLKENQKALSLSRGATPGDEALFNLGLIYSHYKYPKRDYNKSLGYFRKLIKDYPKSQLVAQANIWIGVLEVIEEAKQVDIEIEKKKKELTK